MYNMLCVSYIEVISSNAAELTYTISASNMYILTDFKNATLG